MVQKWQRKYVLMTGVALVALSACSDFDSDLRDIGGNGFDTSRAVQELPNRPRPDDRGIISYPNYQVVVAQRDDTIRGIAIRLGLDVNELAEYNGIEPDVILRRDEIIALPSRVAEPTIASGAEINGPIPTFDVSTAANNALDRADANSTVVATPLSPVTPVATTPISAAPIATPAPTAAPVATSAPVTAEPIRHQVTRGQTVFSISRLYNVPVSNIAEWNGLDSEFTIREGQYLLIPQSDVIPATATPVTANTVTAPGDGSQTPVPPSATTPLPTDTPSVPLPAPAAPDIGQPATAATSNARFVTPVTGSIIRAYSPGRNEGIDIGAPAGSNVRAAASGSVAAVTNNTSGVAIVVIKHSDGLLTVYTNIDNVAVSKGDNVSSGQSIGVVRQSDPSFVHFEVRRGLESVDPADYLP